jgi:hypothetical protein
MFPGNVIDRFWAVPTKPCCFVRVGSKSVECSGDACSGGIADDPVVAPMEWHHALGCWLMAERMIPPENRIEIR